MYNYVDGTQGSTRAKRDEEQLDRIGRYTHTHTLAQEMNYRARMVPGDHHHRTEYVTFRVLQSFASGIHLSLLDVMSGCGRQTLTFEVHRHRVRPPVCRSFALDDSATK